MTPPPEIRVPDAAGPHCNNRLFEWGMAVSSFLFGLLVTFSPGSLASSDFAPILDVISPRVIAAICTVTGGMWSISLWCNGRWPWSGPLVRSAGAIMGAVILVSIDVALLRQSYEAGRPISPGTSFFSVFAIVSLIAARRAAADVRNTI